MAQTDAARMRALEAQVRSQDERIAELERLLLNQTRADNSTAAAASDGSAISGSSAMARSGSAESAPPESVVPIQVAGSEKLEVSGDLRLREEFNWSDAGARDRWRTALRARLRAAYAVTDMISVGAAIATGDPDDPNSTDITLSNFVDDLAVSLDQAYARMNVGNATVYGGKFPQILRRTDLVWDGDVSPQGLGVSYSLPLARGALDLRTLYFVIDESVGGKDSNMLGGQVSLSLPLGAHWNAELAGAYYDYRLRSLEGADAGDFRSNLIGPDGRYLSDFNLVNALIAIGYGGWDENWPVGFTGDYVRNLGAATSADTGYSLELFAGRNKARGDWRLSYTYSMAETDAVFAAFSHDNFAIATNYNAHALSVDYVPWPDIILNGTYYAYRLKDAADVQRRDWLSRLRLNVLFNF